MGDEKPVLSWTKGIPEVAPFVFSLLHVKFMDFDTQQTDV